MADFDFLQSLDAVGGIEFWRLRATVYARLKLELHKDDGELEHVHQWFMTLPSENAHVFLVDQSGDVSRELDRCRGVWVTRQTALIDNNETANGEGQK